MIALTKHAVQRLAERFIPVEDAITAAEHAIALICMSTKPVKIYRKACDLTVVAATARSGAGVEILTAYRGR